MRRLLSKYDPSRVSTRRSEDETSDPFKAGAYNLPTRARKEAANLRLPVGAHVWPDNGRPELIGLGHHCVVRHDDPFAVEPHAILAVLRIPIDVVDPKAVGEGAAEALAAREPVEPRFQRRTGIAAIVTRERDDPPTADGWSKLLDAERAGRCQRPNKQYRYEQDLTHCYSAVLKVSSVSLLAAQAQMLSAARMARMPGLG